MTTVPHALASETGNPASVKGKTYKIGTDTTFAPFEYRENGKMTGIDMELIRGIAKEEGFKVEIQSLGFNAALQALSSNQVDVVIAGMSHHCERKASYDSRIRISNPASRWPSRPTTTTSPAIRTSKAGRLWRNRLGGRIVRQTACRQVRLQGDFRRPILNHVRDGQIRQCRRGVRRLSGTGIWRIAEQRSENRDSEGAARRIRHGREQRHERRLLAASTMD